MKALLLLLAAVAELGAQLRMVEVVFTGIECASCIESLPARIQRMRGVESATVDAARQTLTIKLAAENRVRLEQIRDAIEQDGTKARRAQVTIDGTLSEEDGRWVIATPAGSKFRVALDGGLPSLQYSIKAGRATVTGSIDQLRPESGVMVISATVIDGR